MKRISFILVFALTLLCSNAQKEKHLIAKYSFNEGKPIDDLGKHPPKVYGALLSPDRFGNPNSAYFLNGNYTSFINLGNSNDLKPGTASFSMWFKMDFEIHAGKGVPVNPILFTRCCGDSDFNDALNLIYRLDVKKLSVCNAISSEKQIAITATETLSLRNWHHAVICYNNSILSFYLDGKEIETVHKDFDSKFLNGDSILIGYRTKDKNERFFAGSVDDIEIYDKVLSKEEVMELYNAPNPNKYATLKKWLIVSGVAILVCFIFIYFLRKRIRQLLNKEKERNRIINNALELEVRILKAQMNPHFIFNSLNSILQFIIVKENDKAEIYLNKFSKLIRKLLESNQHESIYLDDELEILNVYLEIESLRFNEIFHPVIDLSPELMPKDIQIPQMMIQPFVENAIWHGLRMKNGKKELKISFTLVDDSTLKCTIEDNGLGRGNQQMSGKPNKSQSLAMGFIRQRLELMSRKYGADFQLVIHDKKDEDGNNAGTVVALTLPILNKIKNAERSSYR